MRKEDRFIIKKDKIEFQSDIKTQKITQYQRIINPIQITKSGLKQFIGEKTSAAKQIEPSKLYRQYHSILDCPQIFNNFYQSILDWSKNGHIGIATNNQIYFMKKQQQPVTIHRRQLNTITCTKFILQGDICVLGTYTGIIQIYDMDYQQRIRTIKNNSRRISCIQQLKNNQLICGSLNKNISIHDISKKDSEVAFFNMNKSQCCGLAKNQNYIAAGYTNGSIQIWDIRNIKQCVINLKNHHEKSAAKALAWCPWSPSILASGGGKNDGKILFWDSYNNQLKQAYQTKTQITNLAWKQSDRLLFSSHDNGLCLGWDTLHNGIQQILACHQSRILEMCFNPLEKDELCTLGADQRLIFWDTKLNNNQKYKTVDETNLKNQLH